MLYLSRGAQEIRISDFRVYGNQRIKVKCWGRRPRVED